MKALITGITGFVGLSHGDLTDPHSLRKALVTAQPDIEIRTYSERLRPSDVTLQIPSTEKFRKITGWEPQIEFEQTFSDTLSYWREHETCN